MPELGLTLLPDSQYQDGDQADGLRSSPVEERAAPSLRRCSSCDSLPQSKAQKSKAGNRIVRQGSLSVSLLNHNKITLILKSPQELDPTNLPDHVRREYIPDRDGSHGKVLAPHVDHTIPKPLARYTSSSRSPPSSHDVSRSLPSESLRDIQNGVPCQIETEFELIKLTSSTEQPTPQAASLPLNKVRPEEEDAPQEATSKPEDVRHAHQSDRTLHGGEDAPSSSKDLVSEGSANASFFGEFEDRWVHLRGPPSPGSLHYPQKSHDTKPCRDDEERGEKVLDGAHPHATASEALVKVLVKSVRPPGQVLKHLAFSSVNETSSSSVEHPVFYLPDSPGLHRFSPPVHPHG